MSFFKAVDAGSNLRTKVGKRGQQNFILDPVDKIITRGFRGRYIRVQPASTAEIIKGCVLSIVEIQFFRSSSTVSDANATVLSASSELKVENCIVNSANDSCLDLEPAVSAVLILG